jgi:integrase
MARRTLTDRKIRSFKPRAKPYDESDGDVPGLAVRVMPSGHRSFVLVSRFPGSPFPTRRAMGAYVQQSKIAPDHAPTVEALLVLDVLTLAEARLKAQAWRGMIGRGVDPAIEEERRRQAELQRHENSFAAVAEAFIADKLPSERKGREVERDIRRAFLPLWGKRPITDITDLDVLAVINAKKRKAPSQARNLLGTASRLFSWAIDQREYGLTASPCQNLKPTKIIGEKASGDRILSDDELFALWRTAKRMGYPFGTVYQILVLTALRLNEAADASWSEFDLRNGMWVIPAERMKARNSKARPHAVPITDDLLAILQDLPRFKKGDSLFSTTFGASPVWMSDKIKKRVNARMLRTLRALARHRGDDPAKVTLPAWKNHDVRRTVRSGLSRLKIAEEVREALLAHVRPGITKTYDHHDYFGEKREALELWAARLRSIVEPPIPNVVPMQARA